MKNKKSEQTKRKPLKELTLLDRFLFDTAMSDPEICRNILSIIFNDRDISNICLGVSEKTQEPYYDSRAVRLDLLAFDEKDVVYDAEAQKENTGNRHLRRRSRLYQSHIDVNLLEPGERDFGKLNDVYVIFIAPFDLFGQEKYMYTFRLICDEVSGMPLNDGAVRIFLNTHGKNDSEVSPELVEFLHYVERTADYDGEIQNSRVRKLADQIEMLKSNQEVGVKYMRLWEELDDARIEGREEERLSSIRNLMDSTGWTAERAMEALKISETERQKYVNMLSK